ncbi:hypothetical protein AAMO2058_001295500 [Amorphochlora amoebiformis]
MPKKKNWGEDTRGSKAKAQKAASRSEKAAAGARAREAAEAAAWSDDKTLRVNARKQAKEEKEMQRRAKAEAKKALLAAEEKELSGIKMKGKRRKAQLAAGQTGWGKKGGLPGGSVKAVSMKAMKEREIKVPAKFVREVLSDLYAAHNPEKLSNLDLIMKKFDGKWSKLEAGLRKKFGENAPDLEALWAARKLEEQKAEKNKMKGLMLQDDILPSENLNYLQKQQEQAGVSVAYGIEDTIAKLSTITTGDAKVDRNPEKRRKALYRAFEEREMARMRAEFPKLKRSQLKERIFEAWKRSPENPMNQKQ